MCVGIHGDSDPVVRGDDLSILEPGDLGIWLVEVTGQGQLLLLLDFLVVERLGEFCGFLCKNICQCQFVNEERLNTERTSLIKIKLKNHQYSTA